MTVISGIFLLSAGFCILMLFVLSSLSQRETPGLKEWMAANAVAFVSFLLYAFGRTLPPLLAYEAANVSYALAGALTLAGFRRFFSCRVPMVALSAGLVSYALAIAVFHYAYDSFPLRTITVSIFQIAILSTIAFTIYRAREQWHAPYPYLFTAATAMLFVLGNAGRAAVHVAQSGEVTSLLQPSAAGVLFLSAGAFVLPLLTFGAVMMVHDRILAYTGHSSRRDFLTGALTRNAFDELLEHKWAMAGRERRKLALLMLAIDDIKSINDNFGHDAGDQALVGIALQADTLLRQRDCLARVGGTEFAILLDDADHEQALATALHLLELIRHARSEPGLPACTVSIGLGSFCQRASLTDTLMRVTQARDAARTAGGNRVVSADSTANAGHLKLAACCLHDPSADGSAQQDDVFAEKCVDDKGRNPRGIDRRLA